MRVRHVVVLLLAWGCASCAARLPARPSGPETPDATAVDAFQRATSHCGGLTTLTAELRLSGRAGDQRLRGTLHLGLAAPAALRVEAIAPFGQPIFILAGRDDRATLLLPRDDRVLRDAPVPALLERLTGLGWSARDLRLILTGCFGDTATAENGRAFAREWQAVSVDRDITAYLKAVNGAPAIVAADHGPWRVDYAQHRSGFPRQVRIRSVSGDVDVTALLEQIQVNTAIDDRAFAVAVPDNAAPMTLDQLRSVVPLRKK
jgi:hypothetical protein